MSTASLHQSHTAGKAQERIARIFSLTFLPLILLVGLLIALSGCSSVPEATAATPVSSVSIQNLNPAQGVPEVLHKEDSAGGVLAKS